MPYNTKQIRPAYVSKYSHKRSNRVVLLMITDGNNNRYYLAVKNMPGLLRGIKSNHDGDIPCLNCFHPYTTEQKLKKA